MFFNFQQFPAIGISISALMKTLVHAQNRMKCNIRLHIYMCVCAACVQMLIRPNSIAIAIQLVASFAGSRDLRSLSAAYCFSHSPLILPYTSICRYVSAYGWSIYVCTYSTDYKYGRCGCVDMRICYGRQPWRASNCCTVCWQVISLLA